jgi:curved DNA-binding protein
MSSGEVHTPAQARAILGLAAEAPPSTWRAAFQREVKSAHPDHGGDSERLRLVIEAWRVLQREAPKPRRAASPARPRPAPEPAPAADATVEPDRKAGPAGPARPPPLPISIVDAFLGCEQTVRMKDRRKLRVRLPAGLQTGDVVRFGAKAEHLVTVQVQPHPGAELRGTDLWLRVLVSPEFLREGGRMEVDTPLGRRHFWVSRTSAARRLFRAPGEGLPGRGARAKGALYLTFELDLSLKASPARSMLKRFAAAWAPS